MKGEKQVCKSCGNEYTKIGVHWSGSDCEYPSLTREQEEIITGLVLGDGSVVPGGKNPKLQVGMITKEYLEYLDNKFPEYSLGVKVLKTSEKSHEQLYERGMVGEENNCSTVYMWDTRNSPLFERWRSWYTDSGKQFPRNLDLSPNILRTWFVCDGDSRDNVVRLTADSQYANSKYVKSYFDGISVSPSRIDKDKNRFRIIFNKKQRDKFYNYIGNSPPGFEYKWPDQKI